MATVHTLLLSNLVKKNQHLVMRMLNVLYSVATRTPHPPEGARVTLESYIKKTCVDVLSFCQDCDMDSVAGEAIKLVENTSFLVDAIHTLSIMVSLQLKEDLQDCEYVSLILSKHMDASSNSMLSTVLRYLKDGKVFERFTGFAFIREKKADDVAQKIRDTLSLYQIAEKVIALSCDGGVLTTSELRSLVCNMKWKNSFGQCCFVPCHFHGLDVILEQSLSQHPKCARLFKTLASARECIRGSRRMSYSFDYFRKNVEVDLTDNNLIFAATAKLRRKLFVDFFKRVVQDLDQWSEADVARAMGLYKILEEFETIFMLEVFFALSECVDGLIYTLKGNSPEDAFDGNLVEQVLKSLEEIDFMILWNQACIEFHHSQPKSSSTPDQISDDMIHNGTHGECRELFDTVITTVTDEIGIRFEHRHKLTFFNLLKRKNRKKCQPKSLEVFAHKFGIDQLNKELDAAYEVITSKPLLKVYEILSAENLRATLKCVRYVTEIVLTMPCKAAHVEEDADDDDVDSCGLNEPAASDDKPSPRKDISTKLDVINFWSTLTTIQRFGKSITSKWSIICIEKDILKRVMSRERFFDDFSARFQIVSPTLQINLKSWLLK